MRPLFFSATQRHCIWSAGIRESIRYTYRSFKLIQIAQMKVSNLETVILNHLRIGITVPATSVDNDPSN